MAAEISVAFRVTWAKSGVTGGSDRAFTATWAAAPPKVNVAVQALSTVEEAILLGEATGGGGVAILRNLDGTNSIHIRQATGAANFMTLGPNEAFPIRWSTSTTAPFAIASAGTPSLEVTTLNA